MVQVMLLAEMLLVPIPPEVSARVEEYAAWLGVGDDMIEVVRRIANGSLGLALIDFERSGYFEQLLAEPPAHLHTSRALVGRVGGSRATTTRSTRRWAALEHCPDGSLGQGVWRFYRARGFTFPGRPESAPPTLAQHDWIHVLADYGSTVESRDRGVRPDLTRQRRSRARSRCSPWCSACSRPATSTARRKGSSGTTAATSRATSTAWRCGSPTRCTAARSSPPTSTTPADTTPPTSSPPTGSRTPTVRSTRCAPTTGSRRVPRARDRRGLEDRVGTRRHLTLPVRARPRRRGGRGPRVRVVRRRTCLTQVRTASLDTYVRPRQDSNLRPRH